MASRFCRLESVAGGIISWCFFVTVVPWQEVLVESKTVFEVVQFSFVVLLDINFFDSSLEEGARG